MIEFFGLLYEFEWGVNFFGVYEDFVFVYGV